VICSSARQLGWHQAIDTRVWSSGARAKKASRHVLAAVLLMFQFPVEIACTMAFVTLAGGGGFASIPLSMRLGALQQTLKLAAGCTMSGGAAASDFSNEDVVAFVSFDRSCHCSSTSG